ncbi:MAG: hypothetical protein HZA17_03930, partial [Nitrospirae bacterium]|nr:hypothetical protein [Nitrospirota bacterium]
MRTLVSFLLACGLFLSLPGWAGAANPETVKKVEQMKQNALEFLNQGKFNKAIPLLREVLSINPSDKTAVRYLRIARQQLVEPVCKQAADAYFESNYAKSIEHWENVLRINPDD